MRSYISDIVAGRDLTLPTVALFSLVAIALVLLCTWRYGVGISPDSAAYLSAARNLLAGRGYLAHDGGPFAAWPPLFPTLLAAIGLSGADVTPAARWLNAVALGGTVFVCGLWFAGHLKSRWLLVGAMCSILFSPTLLSVASMAWTEPVFVLLIVLFLWRLPIFLRRHTLRSLGITCLFAGLCALQRYIGISLIVTGLIAVLFFMPSASLRERLKYAVPFGLVSSLPLAVWATRNYALTGRFSGPRVSSPFSLGEDLRAAADTVTQWFLPDFVPFSLRLFVVAVFLLSVIGTLVWYRRCVDGEGNGVWPAGLFIAVYVPLLAYGHQRGVFDEPINNRYLAPVSVVIFWLVFAALDRALVLWARTLTFQRVTVICVAIWLVYPAAEAYETIRVRVRHGAGQYSTAAWQEMQIVAWLRTHPLEGILRSNAPDALYALVGVCGYISPHRTWDMQDYAASLSSTENEYLVWFAGLPRSYLYDLEELRTMLHIEEVVSLPDGGLYRLRPGFRASVPGGP